MGKKKAAVGRKAQPQARQLKVRMDKAVVALLTPTYNRHRFLPWAARCFLRQDAKAKNVRWYVLDDSEIPCDDLIRGAVGDAVFRERVVYIHVPIRMTIGEKRNAIIQRAYDDGCHIFAAFDDDDWYGPRYVRTVVDHLAISTIPLAGSSEIYLYMTGLDRVAKTDPLSPTHSCNGLLCFRREYWESRTYDVTRKFAEEGTFTNGFTDTMTQLPNPRAYNIALNHAQNTFDKEQLLDKPNQIVKSQKDPTSHKDPAKQTYVKLEDIITDPDFLAFWKRLDEERKDEDRTKRAGFPSRARGPLPA